jgi:hypothetical protein
MKICGRCKKPKSLESFTKDKRKKDGLDRRCRECKAEMYAKIDKKKRSKWRRAYYESNMEHELRLCAIYRLHNKKTRNMYLAAYYKQFPEKGAAKTAKYRASRLKATPLWITETQLIEIQEIYFKCPKGYHVDHIIPLQGKNVRGLHVPWNLQYLPAKENQRKSNRLPPTKSA